MGFYLYKLNVEIFCSDICTESGANSYVLKGVTQERHALKVKVFQNTE